MPSDNELMKMMTPEANEVTDWARKISLELKHSTITSSHLFLGILRHDGNFAVEILSAMGFDTNDLYRAVRNELIISKKDEAKHFDPNTTKEGIIFNPTIVDVFKQAIAEAQTYNSPNSATIDPLYLLFGILHNKESEISHMLHDSEITYEEVKKFFENWMKDNDMDFGITRNENVWEERDRRGPMGGGSHKSKNKKRQALEAFGENLVLKAKEGKIDPIIGRDREIERAWQALARKKKNNVIFTGDSGCVVSDTKIKIRKISDKGNHTTQIK